MKVLKAEECSRFYAEAYDGTTVDEHLILYETRDGSSIVDSPLALFLQISQDARFRGFRHVWVVASDEEAIKSGIPEALRGEVEFVLRNSERYLICLLQAKYLFNNSTFQSFFLKKPEQVYVNTWHGTPLKFMGFDIPGNPAHSQNVLRNLLMTDFFLSPNPHTTKVFQHSYRMDGIYPGTFLEAGYPRIDATIHSDRQTVITELEDMDVEIAGDLPIILYMPTWRGASVASPTSNVKQIIQETLHLKAQLAGKYQVLVKVHPYVYRFIKDEPLIQGSLIPDQCDANRILAMVDILITDFSSVFFDFLVTDKPVLFYAWDQDLYQDERGMYFSLGDLPGPVFQTIQQIESYLLSGLPDQANYQMAYNKMKAEITPYDDGRVSKRIVERIFFGQALPVDQGREVTMLSDKKKLLIYAGGMMNNGITSSLLNLLTNLDKAKYDITLLCQQPKASTLGNFAAIPAEVRLFFKPGPMLFTAEEAKSDKRIMKDVFTGEYPVTGYQRESKRVFAGLSFDAAIDFSGYSFYWSKYPAFADAKKRVVFIHNDIWEDAHKEVDGEKPHLKNLLPLFHLYQRYEAIVSVSESLKEINQEKLSQYVKKEQMQVVMNSLNLQRILQPESSVVEKEEVIHKISVQFKIDQMRSLPIFSRVPEAGDEVEQELKVTPADHVTAVAYADGASKAYKLLLNDVYIGWSTADFLAENQEPVILDRKKTKFVASLRRNQNYLIYPEIPANTAKGPFRGRGRDIQRHYVWVREEVDTMIGVFCHIYDRGKELGWIDKHALANWHKLKPFSPLNGYFALKNRRRPLVFSEEFDYVDQSIKLVGDQSYTIYVKPTGKKLLQVKIADFVPSDFNDYRVIESQRLQGIQWWLLQENGLELGWVRKSDLALTETSDGNVDGKKHVFDLAQVVQRKLSNGGFAYVTMGRMSPEKNQKVLIQAFNEIIKESPEDLLFLIGEGPLRSELEMLVAELGLGEQVVFLGQVADPFPIIKMMDAFVLPSLYEGQPMVLLEALTLGMRVVATNIPQNRQVIGDHEEFGLLTDGTDQTAIEAGLRRIKATKGFEAFDTIKYNQKVLEQFEASIS